MPADATQTFLAAIQASNLLSAKVWSELTAWVNETSPDVNALAKELNKRGWLTPYQIKQIHKGKGADLTLGTYQLCDLLGEGGMGQVFRAKHTRLGREVALKFIKKEKLAKGSTIDRFRQEIQAIAQLSHPNVVLAYDADEVNGVNFYTMEYVDGPDLTRIVRDKGPVSIPEGCEYIRQAALGLQHAAQRGLVHRDIKPSNILVSKSGQVKLLDLGLAMFHQPLEVDAGRVTVEGFILGTPDFLAPEQARDSSKVDVRADIYSLGATLYYILTGKVPYEMSSPTDKVMAHCMAPVPSLCAKLPQAPPALDAVIQWMMAKLPEHRPQVPAQVAAALQPFCTPPSGAIAPPPSHIPGYYPAPQAPAPAPAPDESSIRFAIPREETQTPPTKRKVKHPFPTTMVVVAVSLITLFVGAGFVLNKVLNASDPEPEAEFRNSLEMKMIRLPGGTFTMGSPKDEPRRGDDEGPQREVTLSGPFFMSATEVTELQYHKLVGSSPSQKAKNSRTPAEMPVDSVNYGEAVEFCKKLTEREIKRRKGWEYRLPTEAEWEYACRAGTNTPYWSGTGLVPDKHAVYTADKDDPLPDGAKDPRVPIIPGKAGGTEANPFGLHDMHGNVAEWVWDWYAPYTADAVKNPTGPADGDFRIARGGSWDMGSAGLRSAARMKLIPSARISSVGFRVVYAPITK
jgi:serine/threonine protein kinase